jgi:hypothetical protein
MPAYCVTLMPDSTSLKPISHFRSDLHAQKRLTPIRTAHKFRRHDDDRKTRDENRKALLGWGKRARVVERSHHLNRSPA